LAERKWASLMNSELPRSADALLAERERLEEELQSCEDWLELLHLKSRKDREGASAVNSARLEMVLLDSLAENPTFVRYKAVCVALERLIRGLPSAPAARAKPKVEEVQPPPPAVIEDLTQIRGIGASMARRLNDAGVTTFAQIAEWRAADIRNFSAELGLAKQIYTQNWIEQAAVLANASNAPAASAKPIADAASRSVQPPQATGQQFVQPVVVAKVAVPPPAAVPQPQVELQPRKAVVEPARVEAGRVETAPVRPAVFAAPPAVSAPPKDVHLAAVSQPVNASAPQPLPAAPTPQKSESLPAAPPPKPLAPPQYGKAPELPVLDARLAETKTVEAKPGDITSIEAKGADVKTPDPVVAAAGKAQLATASAAPDVKTIAPAVPALPQPAVETAATAPPQPLLIPPRPFVVTRASVAALPREAVPAPTVAPPPRAPEPAVSIKPASTVAPPLPPRPVAAPPPQPSSAAPSMTITEAIAYAAEVARQGQRPDAARPATASSALKPAPDAAARPPLNGKSAAPMAASSAASAPAREAVRAAALPPPLPPGFVPPDDSLPVAADLGGARNARNDAGGQRLSFEEATVEIVRRSAPPPASQLPKPAVIAATQDAGKSEPPRATTPMGRFLKALTGNN
jgi:predicted flap endonuclease-1-like 5' DNA nuclease